MAVKSSKLRPGKALAYWKTLKTDEGASFDMEYTFDAADIEPMITCGTNPGMGIGISQHILKAESLKAVKLLMTNRNYMGFHERRCNDR